MLRWMVSGVAFALLSGVQVPAQAQPAIDRAAANYVALQRGTKRLADLTPQEIAEVSELDRELARKKPIASRDCDRQRDAARSDLDRAVLALKCPPEPD